MRRRLSGLALALALAAPDLARGGDDLALTGGTVLDGSGAPPRSATLLVRGDRVAALLGPGAAVPPGTRVVDVTGRTLIPGLIDACLLLDLAPGDAPARHAAALDALLASGVTTARLMEAPLPAGLALRQAVAAGALPGPRLLVAGPTLDIEASGDPDALLREIRHQAASGADAIALGPRATPEAVRAAVAEGRQLGIPVVGRLRRTPWTFASRDRIGGLLGPAPWSIFYAHPRERETIRAALRTGGEIEAQLEWLVRVDVESEEMRRVRRWLRRRGTPVTPLLARQLGLVTRDGATTEEHAAVIRHVWPKLAAHVARLHRAGVPLVAGSGAGPRELAAGGGLVSELELLVLAGLTPLEAITTATGGAARALGLGESTGRLAPGMRADVVVLERSPLADIANLRRVERLFVAGREWHPGGQVADGMAPPAAATERAALEGMAPTR